MAFTYCKATDVVHPRRMDIIAKAGLFRAWARGVGTQDAERVYCKHILERTAGIEPADFLGRQTIKNNLSDYVNSARELFWSMRGMGFSSDFPIPIDSAGLPLNGAHRLACALALGQDVLIERISCRQGAAWDAAFFTERGLSKRDLGNLLSTAVDLLQERALVFCIWPPALAAWDEILGLIAERMPLMGYIDIAFSEQERPGFEAMVYDVYANDVSDFVCGMGHIDRKCTILRNHPCFARVGVALLRPEQVGGTTALVKELKAEIRQAFAHLVPVEHFATVHISETQAEAAHLASVFLDSANLQALRQRPTARPRQQFLSWLNSLRQCLVDIDIGKDDCCVVGSSVLEVCGVRLSTDIDCIIRQGERDKHNFSSGVVKLPRGIDLVTSGYHRRRNGQGVTFTDDQIISVRGLHWRTHGFKIVAPNVVRDRKEHSRRAKDLLDIELIDQVISRLPGGSNTQDFC